MAQLTWRDISAPQANMQGIATAGNLFNTAMGNFQSILDRKVENDTAMALRQLQEAQTPEQAKQIGSSIQGAFVDPTKVNTQVDALTKALQDKQFKEQEMGFKQQGLELQQSTLGETIRANQEREKIQAEQAAIQRTQVEGTLEQGKQRLTQQEQQFAATHGLKVDEFEQAVNQWNKQFDLTKDRFGLDKDKFELLKKTTAFNEYMQLSEADRVKRQDEFNNRIRNETLAIQQNADNRAEFDFKQRNKREEEGRLFNQMQAALPETQKALNTQLQEKLFDILAPATGGGYNAVAANEAIAGSIRTDGTVDINYLNNAISKFVDITTPEGRNLAEDILFAAKDISGKNRTAMSQAVTEGAKAVSSVDGARATLDQALTQAATPYSIEADMRRQQEIDLRARQYITAIEGAQPASVENLDEMINSIFGEDYSKSAKNQAKEYVGRVVGGRIESLKGKRFTQSQIAEALAAGFNPGFIFDTFDQDAFEDALIATEGKTSTIDAERIGLRVPPTAP